MPNYRRLARESGNPNTFGPAPTAPLPVDCSEIHMVGFAERYPLLAVWLRANTTVFSESLKHRIRGGRLLTPNQLTALERTAKVHTKMELP